MRRRIIISLFLHNPWITALEDDWHWDWFSMQSMIQFDWFIDWLIDFWSNKTPLFVVGDCLILYYVMCTYYVLCKIWKRFDCHTPIQHQPTLLLSLSLSFNYLYWKKLCPYSYLVYTVRAGVYCVFIVSVCPFFLLFCLWLICQDPSFYFCALLLIQFTNSLYGWFGGLNVFHIFFPFFIAPFVVCG